MGNAADSDAVPGIEPRGLVIFGQRRIVERILDEIVDDTFAIKYGLTDIDQLGRNLRRESAPLATFRLSAAGIRNGDCVQAETITQTHLFLTDKT